MFTNRPKYERSVLKQKRKRLASREKLTYKPQKLLILIEILSISITEIMMTGMFFQFLVLGAMFFGANLVYSTSCSTTAIGTVVLNSCPLSEHRFEPGDEILEIRFEDFDWELPNVVVSTRVLRMGDLPPSVPMGILTFPKGIEALVQLTNAVGCTTSCCGLHRVSGFPIRVDCR